MNEEHLESILKDKALARFGDSLLNFAYSVALTEISSKPKGTKVPDKVLAEAAVKAGLRSRLPRRVGRGDIANGLEALLGETWLENLVTLDEIVACLKAESLSPVDNFTKLAELALGRLNK